MKLKSLLVELMRYLKFFTLPFLFILCISACANGKKIDACTVKNPPKQSRIVQTRAVDFKLYPAQVPDKYTGCGKAWLSNGYLLMQVRFEGGVIRHIEIFEPDEEKVVCQFDESNNLIVGPVEACSGFNDYRIWQGKPR